MKKTVIILLAVCMLVTPMLALYASAATMTEEQAAKMTNVGLTSEDGNLTIVESQKKLLAQEVQKQFPYSIEKITMNAAGTEVSEIPEHGNFDLTIEISCTSYTPATIISAAYDENKRMVAIKTDSITEDTLTSGICTLHLDQSKVEIRTVKVFVWDSLTGMKPLAENYTIMADTTPTITVSSVQASPGATDVEVSVSIRNNPGVLGMTLKLNYDADVLTLKSAANGEAMSALTLTKPGSLKPQCNFVWDGTEISEEETKDGVVLTLMFDVSASASNGTHSISLSYTSGDIIDNELQPVTVVIKNGGIQIAS